MIRPPALAYSLLLSLITAAPCAAGAETGEAPATQPAAPYRVNHDAPLDATEQLVAEAKDHAQYRVEFNGINADRVPAFLYVPRDGKGRHPAVLLQYGSGGNKRTDYIVALAHQFVARGFLVLTIDVPNRGERRAKGPRNPLEGLMQGGTFLQTLGDYSRAVDYLVKRDDIDPDRIGYAGISLGAITGIVFVAHEPRVSAMVSIVGGANMLGTLKVPIDPGVRLLSERIDPFYHVARIAPRPLLLLNAKRDQLVPRFFGEQLHKAAGEHGKKVWIDTDHFFTGVDRYAVLETVIDFMQESLTPKAKHSDLTAEPASIVPAAEDPGGEG